MISVIDNSQNSLISGRDHKSFFLFRPVVANNQEGNFVFSDGGQGFRKPVTEDRIKNVAQSRWYSNIDNNNVNLETRIIAHSAPSGGLEKKILSQFYDEGKSYANSDDLVLSYLSIIPFKSISNKGMVNDINYTPILSLLKQNHLFKDKGITYSKYGVLDEGSYAGIFTYDINYAGLGYEGFGINSLRYEEHLEVKYTALSFTDLSNLYLNSSRHDYYLEEQPLYHITNNVEKRLKTHSKLSEYSSRPNVYEVKKNDYKIEVKTFVPTLDDYTEIKQIKVNPVVKQEYSIKKTNSALPHQIKTAHNNNIIKEYRIESKETPKIEYRLDEIKNNQLSDSNVDHTIKPSVFIEAGLNADYKELVSQSNLDFVIKFNDFEVKPYQHEGVKYDIKDLKKVLYSDEAKPYKADLSLISSDTLGQSYPLENLISRAKLSVINPSVFRNQVIRGMEISDITEERAESRYKKEKKAIEEESSNEHYEKEIERRAVTEDNNVQEESSTKKTELEEKVEKYDKKTIEDTNIGEKANEHYDAQNKDITFGQVAGLGLAGLFAGIGMGAVSAVKALTQKKEETNNKAETIEEVIKEIEFKTDYKPLEVGEGYEVWHNEKIDESVLKGFKGIYNKPTTIMEYIDNKTGKIGKRDIKSDSIFNYVHHVLKEKGFDVEVRQGYTDWTNGKWVDGLIIDLKDYEARKKDGLIIKINGKEVAWESGKENPLLDGQYSDLTKDINVEVLNVTQGDYKDENADTGHDGVPVWQNQITEEYKGKSFGDITANVKKKNEQELKEMLGEHYQTKVFVANQFCYFVDTGLSLDTILDGNLFEQYKGKEIKIVHKSYLCGGSRFNEFHQDESSDPSKKYQCKGSRYFEFHKDELTEIIKNYPCQGARYSEFHNKVSESRYPCNGVLKPLYNLLHEKNKRVEIDDSNPLKGIIFPDVEIQKDKNKGKTVKEFLEHIFDKPSSDELKIKREYSINPKTNQEELAELPQYAPDAVEKLGNNLRLEVFVNEIKSPLNTKLNVGDKISLAYVAQRAK